MHVIIVFVFLFPTVRTFLYFIGFLCGYVYLCLVPSWMLLYGLYPVRAHVFVKTSVLTSDDYVTAG